MLNHDQPFFISPAKNNRLKGGLSDKWRDFLCLQKMYNQPSLMTDNTWLATAAFTKVELTICRISIATLILHSMPPALLLFHKKNIVSSTSKKRAKNRKKYGAFDNSRHVIFYLGIKKTEAQVSISGRLSKGKCTNTTLWQIFYWISHWWKYRLAQAEVAFKGHLQDTITWKSRKVKYIKLWILNTPVLFYLGK